MLGEHTNYSAALFFGSDLMLPAAGAREYALDRVGALVHRGYGACYWSSSQLGSPHSWGLRSTNSDTDIFGYYRPTAISVRCVAEDSKSQLFTCGAYIAPGVWKEFDCYNLAAIGKTTNDDPFTPSWRLIGGYWQWGRKGPHPSQRYDTNTEHFAHGPTGPGSAEANEGEISGWDSSDAPDRAWSDTTKTANDPCPEGSIVPTESQWHGVMINNTESTIGTWSASTTNYSSARFFGNELMLPAAGYRNYSSGALSDRGSHGDYWSRSHDPIDSPYYSNDSAWHMGFNINGAGSTSLTPGRRFGYSVRCIQ